MLLQLLCWLVLAAARRARKGAGGSESGARGGEGQVLLVSLPWYSNLFPLRVIGRHLLTRNYSVLFAAPEDKKDVLSSDGFTFISAGNTSDIVRPFQKSPYEANYSLQEALTRWTGTLFAYQEAMFPPLLAQLRGRPEPPGLMVVDRFALAGFDLASALQVSYIVVNPSLLLGLDGPEFATTATFAFNLQPPVSLYERARNLFHHATHRFHMLAAADRINRFRQQHSVPVLTDLQPLHQAQVVLTNTVFGMESPRVLPPRFKLVGPLLPLQPLPVPARLLSWLDARLAEGTPVAVWSFPSPSCSELTRSFLARLWAAHGELGLAVLLLREDGSARDCLPANILPERLAQAALADSEDADHAEHGAEQAMVLVGRGALESVVAHNATTLLVSHCELQDVQEAVFYGKQAVAVPFYLEQWEVAHRLAALRAASILDPSTNASASDMSEVIRARLSDPELHNCSSRFQLMLKAAGGTKEAVTLVELVYRIGPAHLLTLDQQLPWYKKYLLLDVYAVYSLFLGTVAFLIRQCWAGMTTLLPEPEPLPQTLPTHLHPHTRKLQHPSHARRLS